MIPNFDARFDAAYSAQLYRRFCTEADRIAYSERYVSDPTDLEAESVDYYQPDHPLDESEPF